MLTVADPLGRAAGLVALFMVGLYVFDNRSRLLHTGVGALTATALKLGAYPAIMVGVVLLTAPLCKLSDTERAVLILQCAMPVAITTFALAEEYRTGRELLASAIVFSTLASLVTLPLLALWIGG